jgi:hypothetical protein
VPQAQHHLGGVFASAEFETSYNVRYQVQTDGRVNVNQDISLTNKLSSVYATQYALTLQSGQIENIKASDGEGPLKIEVNKTDEITVINLTFNQQVVGTGKTLNFNLSYDNLDLAHKNGQVWEVFVPKMANPQEIDNFVLWLAVPTSFGNPAFINPEPIERKTEENFNYYRFSKNQLAIAGVSAAFGQFQIFDFILNYHLENPNLIPGETEISFPPDTAFQQVSYQKITPSPVNIRVDADGNWLGKYRLGPNEKLNITAEGKVKIFAQPQEKFLAPTDENLRQNLLSQKYWEVDNPIIQAKAKDLKTPRVIYDFVVKTLDYDFSRVKEGVERKGAIQALNEPKNSICMEFTDLFIALARAAGIPAREIEGFAYTTNVKLKPLSLVADVLHSWPEYWDEKRQIWVPVDPTWEKTTGGINFFDKTDLNHFVFAIHGESSLQPFPAGSYKSPSSIGKDVQVVFGHYEQEGNPKLEVEFKLPKKIFAWFGGEGEIRVKNSGQQAFYKLKLTFEAEKLNLISPAIKKVQLAVLPPFGSQQILLKIKPADWWSFGKGTLSIMANNQEFKTTIKIGSVFWQLILPLVGIILAIGFLVTFMVKQKQWQSKNI